MLYVEIAKLRMIDHHLRAEAAIGQVLVDVRQDVVA